MTTWYLCLENLEVYNDTYIKGEEYANIADDVLDDYGDYFEEKETVDNIMNDNEDIFAQKPNDNPFDDFLE